MPRLLVPALAFLLAVGLSLRADEKDAVKEKLFAAKKEYDAEMKAYRTAAEAWFDKREEGARKAGDKKLVDQIKVERTAFDESGTLPKGAPAAIPQKATAARKALEAAYTQAVKDYVKGKKDDEAAAIEKEWKELAGGLTLDLLPLVDLKTHAVSGEWKWSGKVLIGASTEKQGRLQLPYEPSEEYDIEVGLRRVVGKDGFSVGLALGDRQVLAMLDGWPALGYSSGLDLVDGKPARENTMAVQGQQLKAGKDHTIICSVRTGKIDMLVNGKAALSFKGEFARLSLFKDYVVPNPKALFLLLGPQSSYQIDRIVVTPVKGKGTILK